MKFLFQILDASISGNGRGPKTTCCSSQIGDSKTLMTDKFQTIFYLNEMHTKHDGTISV
jgi:hypothetical protein